jgi:uncharacterized short protein YbdD (DUF466 family)
MTVQAMRTRVAAAAQRTAEIVRRLIGVPDYDRYFAHVRATHPGCEPLPRDVFVRKRMEDRYSRPGARCC